MRFSSRPGRDRVTRRPGQPRRCGTNSIARSTIYGKKLVLEDRLALLDGRDQARDERQRVAIVRLDHLNRDRAAVNSRNEWTIRAIAQAIVRPSITLAV